MNDIQEIREDFIKYNILKEDEVGIFPINVKKEVNKEINRIENITKKININEIICIIDGYIENALKEKNFFDNCFLNNIVFDICDIILYRHGFFAKIKMLSAVIEEEIEILSKKIEECDDDILCDNNLYDMMYRKELLENNILDLNYYFELDIYDHDTYIDLDCLLNFIEQYIVYKYKNIVEQCIEFKNYDKNLCYNESIDDRVIFEYKVKEKR